MEQLSFSPSLCAAKDFVVFVVPLLEARLLYRRICHLTLFSGTSNKHRHEYVTQSSNCLQTTGGAYVCFDGCPSVACFVVCAGVRGLRVLLFVRVSEGCVFWCEQDTLLGVSCHGITVSTCIYREKANYWSYSFVVSCAAPTVCNVRYS